MRLLLTLVLAVVLTAPPALAGTADAPEITDPCGQLERTDPNHVQPQNDICAAWFTTDLTGGTPAVSVTVRTLEPTVEQARVVRASWTAGACDWRVTYDDAVASPRPIIVHEGSAVFPNQHIVRLQVECDPYTRPCEPDPMVLNCTNSGYERSGWAELPADAVTVDGTDVTLTVDLATLDLSEEVEGEAFAPGDTLTQLRTHVSTTATGVATLNGGYVASVGSTGVGFTTSDDALGDSYTLPVQDPGA